MKNLLLISLLLVLVLNGFGQEKNKVDDVIQGRWFQAYDPRVMIEVTGKKWSFIYPNICDAPDFKSDFKYSILNDSTGQYNAIVILKNTNESAAYNINIVDSNTIRLVRENSSWEHKFYKLK